MKPRALSTLIVPIKFCMPATGSAAQRDRVLSGLAVDIERVVAGGEDIDRVVAGAGVEGRRVERRRVVHDERVAAAAGVDRERRKVERIVGRGGASGHGDAARGNAVVVVERPGLAGRVVLVVEIEVREARRIGDRDRALDICHRAGAAGRADVDRGDSGIRDDIDRLVIGERR